MIRLASLLVILALACVSRGADLTRVDRRITREPAYRTGSPKYVLLVIGPEARDRVWIVQDGEDLYVDRNGNGDLTEAGEKLAAKDSPPSEGRNYTLTELTINGRTHTDLDVRVWPLSRWNSDDYAKRPGMQAALKQDPNAQTLTLAIEAVVPHLKAKGRVGIYTGAFDLNGPLVLADRPADAPIIHCGGPLEVTILHSRPTLLPGRPNEVIARVGTPGLGAGTFAILGYEGTIPPEAKPRLEITFPPPKPGAEGVKRHYELAERC